jgi:hypothetical protein
MSLNLVRAQGAEEWEEQNATLVGRISYLEGQLARYNPDTDDWEATTKEAPFGLDDLLYAEADVKAEFIMPNNTWIRIGGDTRIQLVGLEPDGTKLDIAFGRARLYNKSAKAQIKATTPFGHITAPPGSIVDLTINENSVEIIAIKKKVFFIHNTSPAKHEIRSSSSAMLADIDEVTATQGEIEYAWKKWNQDRDTHWASRLRSKGASIAHLPTELHTETYPLDQHGVWEKVYYDGAHYRFWRPIHVRAGWAPFTTGVWSVWHGDHVWIPHEPFGYVTHHYGNWIFTAGFWYWAPPVTRVMIHAHVPRLKIGLCWYPGRVAWIHHGAHLGWIPLAPREIYYSHHRWGRRSIVVTSGTRYRHRPNRYRHHKHAVVIHRSHLYRSGNYKRSRIRSIHHNTIRDNYKTTPVLNATVIKDHGSQRKAKNRFIPAHQTKLSKHPPRFYRGKQQGRLSSAPPRQRGQSQRIKSKIGNQRNNYKPENNADNRKQRLSGKSNHNVSQKVQKHRPKTRSGPKKNHRVRERTDHSTYRDSVRPDTQKTRETRDRPKRVRIHSSGRSQNLQKKSPISSKRARIQSAPSNPKSVRTDRSPSDKRQPASRVNNSTNRIEKRSQNVRQQIRQPKYRSQNGRNKSLSSTRQQQSTSGGNRYRNRN